MSDLRYGYTFVWVDDVPATVEFYEQALGLQRRVLVDTGENGWYAELATGPTTVAIADAREARRLLANVAVTGLDPAHPGAFQLSFVTDDVPAAYQRALNAGAKAQAEPETKPWGQTIARVQDPNGLLVSFATPPPSTFTG